MKTVRCNLGGFHTGKTVCSGPSPLNSVQLELWPLRLACIQTAIKQDFLIRTKPCKQNHLKKISWLIGQELGG